MGLVGLKKEEEDGIKSVENEDVVKKQVRGEILTWL